MSCLMAFFFSSALMGLLGAEPELSNLAFFAEGFAASPDSSSSCQENIASATQIYQAEDAHFAQ